MYADYTTAFYVHEPGQVQLQLTVLGDFPHKHNCLFFLSNPNSQAVNTEQYFGCQ